MKQVVQVLRTGEIDIREVPIPYLEDKFVLVQNISSLISAGTEKSKIDIGKKNLIQKAKARPDLVKKVLEKVKSQGLKKTIEIVNDRLDSSSSLGYSSAGKIVAVGGLVKGFQVGDLVACAGAGYANHAEFISVPMNLVCKIPENITSEEAAFATIGAIAMQGIRLAAPRLGETYLVIGLGLIGQLVTQLLKANGCSVIGTDLDNSLVKKIRDYECIGLSTDENITNFCLEETNGYGVDGVIVCAGTKSNSVIEMCGNVTREKGKVVVIGAINMDIPREPFYMKEIDLVISRSYGPGRYDKEFEENGNDYPLPYVRFTQQRNMESFLKLVSQKKVNVKNLITHKFELDRALLAYEMINKKIEKYIGIIINYKNQPDTFFIKNHNTTKNNSNLSFYKVSFIGAGNYATSTLMPIINNYSFIKMTGVCTQSGITAENISRKFNFKYCTSSLKDLISDTDILFISSIHNNHASNVIKGLKSNKHIYVDKPLCLNLRELKLIDEAYNNSINSNLLVGFNRRFAPATKIINDHFKNINFPLIVNIRINAGHIDINHWINNPLKGGGRIIGEACHFIDLASAIVKSPVKDVFCLSLNTKQKSIHNNDNVSINLRFKNGSIANILYTSEGSKKMGKELIEIFGGGNSAMISDFKEVNLFKKNKIILKKNFKTEKKGQKEMFYGWFNSIRNGEKFMDYSSIRNTTIATISCLESLSIGQSINIS